MPDVYQYLLTKVVINSVRDISQVAAMRCDSLNSKHVTLLRDCGRW